MPPSRKSTRRARSMGGTDVKLQQDVEIVLEKVKFDSNKPFVCVFCLSQFSDHDDLEFHQEYRDKVTQTTQCEDFQIKKLGLSKNLKQKSNIPSKNSLKLNNQSKTQPNSLNIPGSSHGKTSTALNTPGSRHGKTSTALNTPGSSHSKTSTALNTPGSIHGKTSTALNTPGSSHGKTSTALNTPGSSHGKTSTALNTPGTSHNKSNSASTFFESLELAHKPQVESNSKKFRDFGCQVELCCKQNIKNDSQKTTIENNNEKQSLKNLKVKVQKLNLTNAQQFCCVVCLKPFSTMEQLRSHKSTCYNEKDDNANSSKKRKAVSPNSKISHNREKRLQMTPESMPQKLTAISNTTPDTLVNKQTLTPSTVTETPCTIVESFSMADSLTTESDTDSVTSRPSVAALDLNTTPFRVINSFTAPITAPATYSHPVLEPVNASDTIINLDTDSEDDTAPASDNTVIGVNTAPDIMEDIDTGSDIDVLNVIYDIPIHNQSIFEDIEVNDNMVLDIYLNNVNSPKKLIEAVSIDPLYFEDLPVESNNNIDPLNIDDQDDGSNSTSGIDSGMDQTSGEEPVEVINLEQDERFDCSICNKFFSKRRNLRKHMNNMHYEKAACELCLKVLRKAHLALHIKHKHSYKPVICSCCSQFFYNQYERKFHSNYRSFYLCHVCGCNFGNFGCYERHILEHAGNNCVICSQTLPSTELLIEHVQNSHNATEITKLNNEKKYICEVCSREFKKKIMFIRHQSKHTLESKTFICSICNKVFSLKHQLQAHEKGVHCTERYKCNKCGKMIKNKYKFRSHVAGCGVSLDCNVCGKGFKNEILLKEHSLEHWYNP